MSLDRVIGILFGVSVIVNAVLLIGVIGGWTVAVFIIAGLSLIFNEVFKDV